MSKRPRSTFEPDAWAMLRRFTAARIALGRMGASLPTAPHLDFQLAHAAARDAVHAALDPTQLARDIGRHGHEVLTVASRAGSRVTYLKRPDLGRRLDEPSRAKLEAWAKARPPSSAGRRKRRPDAAIVVADGLSALAVARHAPSLVKAIGARLAGADEPWSLAPVVIASQARVAIGDEIGAILGSRIVAVLIGERPGLSAPDSLGVYLTWGPAPGRTDAERNCISNIREAGLSIDAAASTLLWLMTEARRHRLTGVELKDETAPAPVGTGGHNFLIGEAPPPLRPGDR